jgi:hypothetical protein
LPFALAATGCVAPGAIGSSTLPLGDSYAQLSNREESSSCGYTFLTIPVKNPVSFSDLIEELVKSHGGDALINVTSYSSQAFYLLGMSNCIGVEGLVIKTGK